MSVDMCMARDPTLQPYLGHDYTEEGEYPLAKFPTKKPTRRMSDATIE